MSATMTAPPSGVKVRMYRQGHGDCFLLAFSGRNGRKKRNVYVLIDCGLKPKSEVKGQSIEAIVDDIHAATGGHIDVVVVTHEHQDHVNGFSKKRSKKHIFDKIAFDHCWLAWTEDGTDDLANALRERFSDTLVTLALAQSKVRALGIDGGLSERLSDFIGLEVGDDGDELTVGAEGAGIVEAFLEAAANSLAPEEAHLRLSAVAGITNKRAIKYLRDRAAEPETFLGPHLPPVDVPHVGVRGSLRLDHHAMSIFCSILIRRATRSFTSKKLDGSLWTEMRAASAGGRSRLCSRAALLPVQSTVSGGRQRGSRP